ncbi:hypothetical protein N7481_009213 [Penicillium waksmanii]|uniref:uncharacterized protein n=1 Tax=Penicillium waksmanii TaxID=69791 RepID=UPI002548CFD5|nr:uncharacterized protein N7481_009213 [Penicillium waksmanii]KAJ5975506.1 hypothetical protein N7481_009213 [Penicillium waksmanii]
MSSPLRRLPPVATITKKDLLLAYIYTVVNLSDFDNSEIRRAVLPHTESDYERILRIFDNYILKPRTLPTSRPIKASLPRLLKRNEAESRLYLPWKLCKASEETSKPECGIYKVLNFR